jgi:ubiquitin-protein ligase
MKKYQKYHPTILSQMTKFDIQDFKRSDINESGIYAAFDEKDNHHVKVLIIGPDNTPYEKGTFFFNVDLSKNHPFEPPQITFMTTDRSTRFHHNLYENGRVFLPIP